MTISGYDYRSEMISSYDDFPVHQTTYPVAYTSSSDPNHYDRYFFCGVADPSMSNGAEAGSSVAPHFALALGLYPNRHVSDASFSVVVDGRQRSVHASQRAPHDRAHATTVGPLQVVVDEPLHRLTLVVDAPEQGIRARLQFTSRSQPVDEPHFVRRSGQRVVFDYTRMTQFGRFSGWLEIDGTRRDCGETDTWAFRDRSWGVRPVGERAALGAPVDQPQFFWLWAPVNFGSLSTHFDVNEDSTGARWHESGFVVHEGSSPIAAHSTAYRVRWRPGTRWVEHLEYTLEFDHCDPVRVTLTPRYDFMMCGLGYQHPEWQHGAWRGESVTGSSVWDLPVAEPTSLEHLHVQTVCDAVLTGGFGEERGVGIAESFVLGPHAPTGLTGLLDPA